MPSGIEMFVKDWFFFTLTVHAPAEIKKLYYFTFVALRDFFSLGTREIVTVTSQV